MTLAGELAGAFLAGIGFTIVMLALFAGRLSRWAMRRMLRNATGAGSLLAPTLQKTADSLNE